MATQHWAVRSVLIVAFIAPAVVDFAAPTMANDAPWSAQWIGVDTPESTSPANSWLCFRNTVDLPSKPKKAMARIAVDSKYWLWLNGELAVFEGQLKRGPTPDDTYFDTVDLTPHLSAGKNTIAVLVWHFGKEGFSHKNSGRAGLVFEANVDGKTITSDASWKAQVHPAYGNTGEPLPNYRLPESNIRFDARRDMAGWQMAEYDDSTWPAAVALGQPPAASWNRLVERPIPLFKDSGLHDYPNASELPKVSDGKAIVAQLPYNAHFTPYLKIDAPAGLTIDIRTDDYLGGGPPNLRAEYITRDGVQEYESLGWLNGHEMHYTIPAGVKILALKYRETGYAADFTGKFQCDDPFFNTLWEKSRRTLYVTMRDTYMDCPDRERAQWWGDAVNEMGEAFYALSPTSRHLARKGILELMNWQRPDKTIYSPVPAGNWDKELPMQMLNSVGYYGFWTYYWYSGDAETIRQVYPRVRDYLAVWKLGPDGLVVPRKGGWTWGDWGENKDMTIMFNVWYYLALRGQREMAQLSDHPDDLPEIDRKMKSIRDHFNTTFWTGTEYRSPGYKGKTDDRVHGLAVVAGLAEPSMYPAIRKVLATQRHASPYTEKYILEALFQMRYEDDAFRRMKQRFAKMVDSPLTTLWEGWGIGREGFGGGTYNHAWSGGPLTLLSQYASGIAPTEPALASYHVFPQMGPLKSVHAVVPTAHGLIDLKMQRGEATFRLDLDSPSGTNALVGIPKEAIGTDTTIAVNGNPIPKGNPSIRDPHAVTYAGQDQHYWKFHTPPGRWRFEARAVAKNRQ